MRLEEIDEVRTDEEREEREETEEREDGETDIDMSDVESQGIGNYFKIKKFILNCRRVHPTCQKEERGCQRLHQLQKSSAHWLNQVNKNKEI